MEIPYNKIQIMSALLGIDETKLNDENKSIMERHIGELLPENKAERNLKIAEHNGITVDQLIASPNMKSMEEDYEENALKKIVGILEAEIGFSNQESWGLIACAMGMFS